jgi:TonB-dependent SusC/RagA subfamily outer membrane receptor
MRNLPNIKFIASVLGVVLFLSLVVSCSSSRETVSADEPQSRQPIAYEGAERTTSSVTRDESRPNQSLVDMLRQVPGLDVRGGHPNASILIRGPKTMFGSNEPLFVVNNAVVGQGYKSVAQSIDPQEVESIRVLKGSQAALYGSRGGNGVVMIYLRD